MQTSIRFFQLSVFHWKIIDYRVKWYLTLFLSLRRVRAKRVLKTTIEREGKGVVEGESLREEGLRRERRRGYGGKGGRVAEGKEEGSRRSKGEEEAIARWIWAAVAWRESWDLREHNAVSQGFNKFRNVKRQKENFLSQRKSDQMATTFETNRKHILTKPWSYLNVSTHIEDRIRRSNRIKIIWIRDMAYTIHTRTVSGANLYQTSIAFGFNGVYGVRGVT